MPTDPSFSNPDATAMRRALSLATEGLGRVEPNPPVGCVITAPDGQVLGEGFHAQNGGPHAEAVALAAVAASGHDPRGGTAYITLEPCSPFPGKRTPPCADALIMAGLKRIVLACEDPHPAMGGRSIAHLRQAGLRVETGLLAAEGQRLLAAYTKKITTGRPWVILKWAQSLDGFTADAAGNSRWISGPDSRLQVHELRARCDAIMVGIGTVLADDPQLTARDVEVRRTARRVVIDPFLRVPDTARLLRDGGPPVTLACTQESSRSERAARLTALGCNVLALPSHPSCPGLSLAPLFDHLGQVHAATRILVEGGASLAGHLLTQDLIDECHVYVSPKLLGQGRPAVVGWSQPLAQQPMWTLYSHQMVGHDFRIDLIKN